MLRNEQLIGLLDAIEQATGRRPHLSTAIRWCTRGARGARLESCFLGGRRLTSVEAVYRFIDASTEAEGLQTVPAMTPRQSAAAAEAAADRLRQRLG